MDRHYIRIKTAAGVEKGKTTSEKLVEKLLFFIPKGNPGYEDKLRKICEWLIEFDFDNLPYREIGFDNELIKLITAIYGPPRVIDYSDQNTHNKPA